MMVKIKLISDVSNNGAVVEEVIKNSNEWGDRKTFLRHVFLKCEIAGIAKNEDNSSVGFSLAKKIVARRSIAIAFLATRVLPAFRNKGIARLLIKTITKHFVIRDKFLNFSNWFKSVYFVTATANPALFESLRKRLSIVPSFGSRKADDIETDIAEKFARILGPQRRFDRENFVISGGFLNSAEFYEREEDIPWSDNEKTNSFLENRIRLKEKKGNGLIVVGKIL